MDQKQEPPRRPGTFLPGHDPRRKATHRPKGSRNKIPNDIRRDCVEGLARHGLDGKGKDGFVGYIQYLASKHPKQAARIVEKILPLTIKGDGLTSSRIGTVNIVSVPEGKYLRPEEIARMAPRSNMWLEHAPEPQPSALESFEQLKPAEQLSDEAPFPEPQSPKEARLLDELRDLSREELLRRAKEAGLVNADEA